MLEKKKEKKRRGDGHSKLFLDYGKMGNLVLGYFSLTREEILKNLPFFFNLESLLNIDHLQLLNEK